MKKSNFKTFTRIIIITFCVMVIIIGGMMTSLSILEDEAVQMNVKMAELQSNTFSNDLENTMNSIDLLTNNITTVLVEKKDLAKVSADFKTILNKNLFIRSINLLQNNQIIVSSNKENLNLMVSTDSFYPKPMFNHSILRVGTPWEGRDFNDGTNLATKISQERILSSFLPISKEISSNNTKFTLLLNINTDYFINDYSHKLYDNTFIHVLRLDGLVIASTDPLFEVGSHVKDNYILNLSLEKSLASGVVSYMEEKSIFSYNLTNNYPLNIGLRINYDQTLKGWQQSRYKFFLITTSIVVMCVILVLVLLFLYNKKQQQELKRHKLQLKNQMKFKTLFENTHFLAAIIQPTGNISEINSTALNVLNQKFSEIKNQKFWELFCFNDNDKIWLQNAILNYKSEIHKELYITNAQGKEIILDFMLSSIYFDNKIELVALSLDITDRKESEYGLQLAYSVFDNTLDGIVITDKNANIISANKAFENCSGYSVDEVLNQNPKILQSGYHDKSFYKVFWKDLMTNGYWDGELINKQKNGDLWSEWLTINTVYDEKGEIKNYIGVFHDTTKQKKQEKELKEKEEILFQQSKMASMGEMIENIAHQWRQPLSVISTIATGIRVRNEIGMFDINDTMQELDTINNSAQFLSKTIDDFRNFLKHDKIKKTFGISSAITKALSIIKSKFKNREIEIIQTIEEFEITGFENELIQVFMNILNNTRDAFENQASKKRYLFISSFKENNKCVILFKDTAGGIPEEIIDKVFEPYFTTKHQTQGTGIGLYMSKQIINNHMGGDLSVENQSFEYENQQYHGACFRIELEN